MSFKEQEKPHMEEVGGQMGPTNKRPGFVPGVKPKVKLLSVNFTSQDF